MKRVSKITLAFALAIGAAPAAMVTPVFAQDDAAVAFNAGNLSEGVRTAGGAAQSALEGETPDTATARTQIEAAEAGIQNNDDRFFVGQLMIQLGSALGRTGGSNEEALGIQNRGIQLSLDSGLTPASQLGTYWSRMGAVAFAERDYARTITAYENALRHDPNNVDAMIQSASAHFQTNSPAGGYELADRAINLIQQSGQTIPPSWIRVPLAHATETRNAEKTAEYGRMLVASQPDSEGWNQALSAYLFSAQLDDQGTLDILRLMNAADALDAESYGEWARLALRRGLPGEAQTAISAAAAAGNTINSEVQAEVESRVAGDRSSLGEARSSAQSAASGTVALNTADAYASYGDYDTALQLYGVASEKGGVDAGTVAVRRAAALVGANRNSEARSALEGVTGTRATLADFWKLWLDQQSGGQSTTATEAAPAEETVE